MHTPEQHLRDLVRHSGPLTFARFMEVALFAPETGYYASASHLQDHGDYFTSPAAHPLFGTLLAIQLQQMWQLLDRPSPFTVVELGAGSGLLASQIAAPQPAVSREFASALRYVTVDRFAPPAAGGKEGRADVSHVVSAGVPLRRLVGCILSNELLDAFPVHRFQVQDGRIREVFVTLAGEEFAEVLDEPSTPRIAQRVTAAAHDLPEGFRGEVRLGLEPWVADAARALQRGFLLTVDYGDTARGLYSADRAAGTVQCYYRHTVSANPYTRVGRQDITAHVDFSALMEAGVEHGLDTFGYTTQREFLANLGAGAFLQALDRMARAPGPDAPRLPQAVYLANRMAIQELLRPEGLGGFRVLAQGRSTGAPELWGFHPGNPMTRALERQTAPLDVPLLTRRHTPLLEGRYPHQAWDPAELWPWADDDTPPTGPSSG